MNDVTITGLAEVQRELTGFTRRMISRSFKPALEAAGSVVQGALKRREPVRKQQPKEREFPPLSDSLVTDIEVDADRNFGAASTGFGVAGGVAMWDEYGHRIVGHSGIDTGKHTPGGPFMRPATADCADEAMDAFADVVIESENS